MTTERHGPPVRNLLTFDLEDYFHATGLRDAVDPLQWDRLPGRVEYTTRRLLRILAEHGVTATFFALGWVANRYPDLVREIVAAGHELASHGWSHELVYEQTLERFRDDLLRTKELLEDVGGRPVLGYRAPCFSVTDRNRWALEVVAETGHRYDASIYPTRRRRYGDPSCPPEIHRPLRPAWDHAGLWEVPATVVRVLGRNVPVAGGGYFRFFPYRVTRAAIRHLNRRSRPAVVYLHPWEIDPDQPRLRGASAADSWRHYLNLDRTEARLRRLLRDFEFGPVVEAIPELEQEWRTLRIHTTRRRQHGAATGRGGTGLPSAS